MKTKTRPFREADQGSTTIEVVLWLPLIVLLLSAIIDLSMLFNTKAEIAGVIRDVNRAVAVKQYSDAQSAENDLAMKVAAIVPNAQVRVVEDAVEVESWVSVPAASMALMGSIPYFDTMNVTMSYRHLLEP